MNHAAAINNEEFPTQANHFFAFEQKALSTVALLVLGYYILNVLDIWPSTIQRIAYEISIYLVPSRLIYSLEKLMARYGRLAETAPRFRRTEFGDSHAKAEALTRLFGNTPIPNALRKTRSLSVIDSLLSHTSELSFPGLGNWDNSCYQNSILQGLASLSAFHNYVERSLTACSRTGTNFETHDALLQLLDQLSEMGSRRTTIWTPRVLKSMDSWQQQDAQEYFSRIMDCLEKEAMASAKMQQKWSALGLRRFTSSDSPNSECGTPVNQQKRHEQTTQSIEQTCPSQAVAVTSPLEGLLAQRLACRHCGFSEGFNLTQFTCLTLNMGLRGPSALEDLLDEYTEPELVEGVECTKCTEDEYKHNHPEKEADKEDTTEASSRPVVKPPPILRTKAKQITVGRLPKDLAIHINRSIFDEYGNQRKNSAPVRVPLQLPFLGKWCADLNGDDRDFGNKTEATYQLKCIVTHQGHHENGHYVAIAQRGKGEWYCFNDDVVTKWSTEDVLSRRNAFMLFYEKVDAALQIHPLQPTVQEISPEIETTPVSSSSSEPEDFHESEPYTPVRPIYPMRTSSGRVKVRKEDSPLVSQFVVPTV